MISNRRLAVMTDPQAAVASCLLLCCFSTLCKVILKKLRPCHHCVAYLEGSPEYS